MIWRPASVAGARMSHSDRRRGQRANAVIELSKFDLLVVGTDLSSANMGDASQRLHRPLDACESRMSDDYSHFKGLLFDRVK